MRKIYLLKFLIEFICGIFWTANISSLMRTGYSLGDSALVMAFFYLSVSIFETPTGLIADKYGRRLSTILGLTAVSVGFLIIFAIGGKIFDSIGMAISGIGFTMISGAFVAWAMNMARDSDTEFRSEIFFLRFDLFGRLAMIAGGFSGVFFLKANPGALWIVLSVVALFALVLAFSIPQASDDQINKGHLDIALLKQIDFVKYAALIFIFLSTLMFGLEQGIRNTIYQPFVLKLRDGNVMYLAYWQSGLAILRLCGLLFYRYFLIRFNKSIELAILSFCLFALTQFIASFTANFWFIFSLWLTAVFSIGWFFPIKDHYINSLIPEKYRATLLSFDNMLFQVGSGLTCLLLYFTVTENNFQKYWALSGSFLLLSILFLWSSSKKGKNIRYD